MLFPQWTIHVLSFWILLHEHTMACFNSSVMIKCCSCFPFVIYFPIACKEISCIHLTMCSVSWQFMSVNIFNLLFFQVLLHYFDFSFAFINKRCLSFEEDLVLLQYTISSFLYSFFFVVFSSPSNQVMYIREWKIAKKSEEKKKIFFMLDDTEFSLNWSKKIK